MYKVALALATVLIFACGGESTDTGNGSTGGQFTVPTPTPTLPAPTPVALLATTVSDLVQPR